MSRTYKKKYTSSLFHNGEHGSHNTLLREFREVLARDKDLVKWMIKPDPTFLGDQIPITGDGTVTH